MQRIQLVVKSKEEGKSAIKDFVNDICAKFSGSISEFTLQVVSGLEGSCEYLLTFGIQQKEKHFFDEEIQELFNTVISFDDSISLQKFDFTSYASNTTSFTVPPAANTSKPMSEVTEQQNPGRGYSRQRVLKTVITNQKERMECEQKDNLLEDQTETEVESAVDEFSKTADDTTEVTTLEQPHDTQEQSEESSDATQETVLHDQPTDDGISTTEAVIEQSHSDDTIKELKKAFKSFPKKTVVEEPLAKTNVVAIYNETYPNESDFAEKLVSELGIKEVNLFELMKRIVLSAISIRKKGVPSINVSWPAISEKMWFKLNISQRSNFNEFIEYNTSFDKGIVFLRFVSRLFFNKNATSDDETKVLVSPDVADSSKKAHSTTESTEDSASEKERINEESTESGTEESLSVHTDANDSEESKETQLEKVGSTDEDSSDKGVFTEFQGLINDTAAGPEEYLRRLFVFMADTIRYPICNWKAEDISYIVHLLCPSVDVNPNLSEREITYKKIIAGTLIQRFSEAYLSTKYNLDAFINMLKETYK